MYSECVRCPKLGKECDGPNFVAMPPQELIAWCKERKKHLGLTNAGLAELSDVSQGTIDSLLANTHPDFKFGTIRPVLQVLVGGKWLGDPCADPTGAADAELKARVHELESELKQRDKEIALLEKNYDDMKTLISNTNKRHAVSQDFMRKVIVILASLLAVCLLVIIGALVVDRLDPSKGFFWIDTASWFGTGKLFKGLA